MNLIHKRHMIKRLASFIAGLLLPALTFSQAVGIGDAAFVPNYLLQIHRNAASGVVFQLTNTATGLTSTDGFQMNLNGTAVELNNRENDDMRFFTNNAERMTVEANGNVGIGIAAPLQRLHVVGNVQFTQALMPGGNAGITGQVLESQGAGVAPVWGSAAKNNVSSVLASDINIQSAVWVNYPTSSMTFTALSNQAWVMFSASGFAYTNSMAYVQFRIWNVTTNASIGGTNTKMQSYDDVTGTVTPWSCSFSKLITGLTPGTSYTIRLDYRVGGILGTYYAAINASSMPDEHHLTLSVLR
ncbi:MAG: fibronectin type III domain-containing protein [Flavobacteriales bacterium]|nr:fibronectin type III domain-containing protein [Flavobacteriales bacterium]